MDSLHKNFLGAHGGNHLDVDQQEFVPITYGA